MLHTGLDEALIDGKLGGHDGVVGGGEHGLDPGGDQCFGSHLHLGGGGAVLFHHLDAVLLAECLGVRNGLGGGILTQVVQQTDGVDAGVCRHDQVHDGVGVQGIGGTGDVLLPVKACGGGVGHGRVDHRDVGVLHSGQHGSGGGGGHCHDHVHAVSHKVCTDLVQVGLVGLRVGIVIGVVKGDTLLLADGVQTALHRFYDLVEGSVVHIVDDAHLEGLASGSGAAGSRCGGGDRCTGDGAGSSTAAAGQCHGRNSRSGQSGLQEAAAGDHVQVFHSGNSFPGAGGKSKDPLPLRDGS